MEIPADKIITGFAHQEVIVIKIRDYQGNLLYKMVTIMTDKTDKIFIETYNE